MRRLVATILLPVVIGVALGVAALIIVLSNETGAAEKGTPTGLTAAKRTLFLETLMVMLGEGELCAYRLGGLDPRPLIADTGRRHIALIAYRGLEQKLESLKPVFFSAGADGPRDGVVEIWGVYLRGAVGWLESQQEFARDTGFIKYMDRPLTSDRPYMVEVDRLLAREDYERAVVMGRMALEQRRLAWRRAESLSSSTLRQVGLANGG
ncbi:hypothetical protein KAU45_05815 [bacterium]|nr:hypothetical protein [bacterium]